MINDTVVDSFLEILKELITSSKLDLIMNEREQLKSLEEKIAYMRGFLKVTEKKRDEHPEVMKLVMQIKDVVSKAEKIVQLFVNDVVKADASYSLREHKGYIALDLFSLNLESVKKEIKSLMAVVKHIYDENMYDINGVPVEKLEHSSTRSGGTTGLGSSGVRHIPKSGEENLVVGFKEEVETLVQRLDNRGEGLEIISIIGAAGGGKTTLAREVYQHPFTLYTFQFRAWVTVSQSYDKTMKRNLLIRLLKSDTLEIHEDYEMSSEDSLGERVLKCLKGRKYLIVMDDIWGIEAWNDIQRSFPKECRGSKVLFTSRFVVQPESVNFISHYLAPLPKDLSWKLLEKKVFGTKDCPRELVYIGEQIVGKCEGLPIAIVAIAGILAKKDKTLDVWKEVAKNVSSVVANKNQDNCMDILELSYNHLPRHLKECFLYMGGFPEGLEIPARELIWLWVDKGFIYQTEEGKSLEDIGKDYLIGLIDRSLVMLARKSSSGGIKACRIHDLMRVLCLKKAEDDEFLEQIYKEGDSFSPFGENMHDRLLGRKYDADGLPKFCLFSFQITLALVALYFCRITDRDSMIGLFIKTIVLQLLLIGMLALFIIGESRAGMVERDIYLPPNLFNMGEVRHLHRKGGVFLYHYRKKFNLSFNLDNLQTLHRICPCKDCQSVLVKTPNLRKLGFEGRFMRSLDGVLIIPDLDLEFLKFLEKLSINYTLPALVRRSNTLPAWRKLPPTITQLTLMGTLLKWEALSILQTLPSLEVLKLLRRACSGPVWNTNELEGFFQLKYLKFEWLNIKEWNASEDQFPRLEVLVLLRCSKLKGIPIDFANLNELRTIELHGCSSSAEESAMEIQEEQRNKFGDDDCLNLTVISAKLSEIFSAFS